VILQIFQRPNCIYTSGEIIVEKALRVFLIWIFFVTFVGPQQVVWAGPESVEAVNYGPMRIDSAVKASLGNLQPGEKLTVIVTLRQQADLSRVNGADRAKRLQGVIRALQATANATQGPLIGMLNSWRAQGLVQSFQSFWVFNGFSVTATSAAIDALARNPDVLSITPDDIAIAPASSAPEPNISLVNAPALWSQGYSGQGVVVANLDSGVDVTHPDLAARWRGGSNSWFDPYGQHAMPVDLSGHGTWTMGIMVGGDAGGTALGVAPGARWIAVRIYNDRGRSTSTAIHQGFQWLLDPDGDPNTADAPQVVNNSWTYANPGCYLDFEPDLQALRAAGILPVFAAGNGGPGSNTSYSPANNPAAFAVGATNNNDQIYTYSSRGPTTCGGSSGPFPELVAPGVNILSTDLYGGYSTNTGTSLAAPHVAGGLALLLSAYPDLGAADQESALIHSAVELGASGPDDVYGYGRLDLLAAFNWLTSNPASTPEPSATPTSSPTAQPSPTKTSTPTPTATPPPSATPTQAISTLHVGDLDGTSASSKNIWNAIVTILVHDAFENPVANASVSGGWSNGASGTASCTTNASGTCQVTGSGLSSKTASVTFSVSNVSRSGLTYDATANHDPDGDSDGTSLTISKH
jgi:serine protease AprX